MQTTRGEHRYQLGHGQWIRQIIHYGQLGIATASTTADQPVAASGAWVKPDQLTLRAWLTATPFRLDVQFNLAADATTLTLDTRMHPLQRKSKTIKGTVR